MAVGNIRSVAATLVAVMVVGVAVLAGDFAGAAVPGKSKPKTVTIKKFKFSPTPLKGKSGGKVTIKNADSATHAFTADKGAFDTGDIERGSPAPGVLQKDRSARH